MKRGCACLSAAALVLSATSLAAQAGHPQETPGAAAWPRVKTHDDLQPATMPVLPAGMRIEDIVRGDSIYHGKGNCYVCHGQEAQGMPAAGNALTVGLNYAQTNWTSLDSLIASGIPQVLTRSPIQMPPRGGRSDLSPEEVRRVAAYVWAISQVRGEPWVGGHASHSSGGSLVAAHVTPTSVRVRADSVVPAERRP